VADIRAVLDKGVRRVRAGLNGIWSGPLFSQLPCPPQWLIDLVSYWFWWPSQCPSSNNTPPLYAPPVLALVQRAQPPQLTVGGAQPPAPGDPKNAKHLATKMQGGSNAASGNQQHPWETLDHALKQLVPNQALYIKAGDYNGGVESLVDGPIWIIGEPGVRIIDAPPPPPGLKRPSWLLRLKNRSWVVQDLEFVSTVDLVQPLLLQNANDILVNNVNITEFHAGAGINVRSSNDCMVTKSFISGGKTYLNENGEQSEAVGLLVGSGSHRIMIDQCDSFNNESDSIQIQDEADNYDLTDPKRPAQDLPTDITVQSCSLYEASGGGPAIGENAIDVKSCDRVVITDNEMYGFRSQTKYPMDSKWGDAVVIHCDADQVIVEKNKIHDCGRAASVGATGIGAGTRGVGKVIFRFNQIYDMKLQPDPMNPNQVLSGSGGAFDAVRPVKLRSTTTPSMLCNISRWPRREWRYGLEMTARPGKRWY
jgi:hypothetical protein